MTTESSSEAVEVVEAIANTVLSPNVDTLMNDVQVALKLATKLKAVLATAHPSVTTMIKALLA